jgi:hypothetical protein
MRILGSFGIGGNEEIAKAAQGGREEITRRREDESIEGPPI